ncbi:MAG: nuclear transport factor 2 family protein [Myxococcales bacterium]|jgi:ketosteroid isomerase-like protein|nr:nuclear transport factor 2 family protein [Myxococcales bacterium]
MGLFDGMTLGDGEAMRAVKAYLEAQANKDFSKAATFFAEDVRFDGLVLKARGRETVAREMETFIRAAIDWIRVEAVAEVEPGARVLALTFFKLKPAAEPQALCDHLWLSGGLITRVENVFDVRKLPPM